ncbi:hypothetical protein BH24DEI1_BH24DEI1_12930 [soil metagenome]
MNSRMKNHTLVGVLAGLILGVLFGLLVGNLALGVIFMVGVALGGLALLEELEVAPRDLGREIWRRLERRRTGSRESVAGRPVVTPPVVTPPVVTPMVEPSLEPAPAEPARRPTVQDRGAQDRGAQGQGMQGQGARPVREEPRVEGSQVVGLAAASTPVSAAEAGEASRPAATTKTPATAPARTVALVAGIGQQAAAAGRARDLYSNPLFELNLQYAESLAPDDLFILSAEHHLLRPDEWVEPYDAFLRTMKTDELKSWSDEVLRKLGEVADLGSDRFVVLAANKYRKHLVSGLRHVELPTEGLSLSEQRDFLKTDTKAEAETDTDKAG